MEMLFFVKEIILRKFHDIGKVKNSINIQQEKEIVNSLKRLPGIVDEALLQTARLAAGTRLAQY